MRSPSNQSPPHRVAGAESGRRLLSVLLSFTERRPLWAVAELAQELNLTQSAVYRYVSLLREVGLVEHVEKGRYGLSDRVTAMSGAARAARTPLGEIAAPVLRRVRDAIDETVILARRSGWNAFAIAREESRKPVRLQFELGQPMRLHVGSMPRLLLSAMPPQEQERYLATLDPSVRNSAHLSPEARERTRKERVTESFEEIDDGIWGVAAAVVDDEGEFVAALGCAAPIYRTDTARRSVIRELIVAGADEIGAALCRAGGVA